MENSILLYGATFFFASAMLHSFLAIPISNYSHRYKEGSIKRNLFHFFGEVEAIFGIWAFLFILFYFLTQGYVQCIHYVSSINFSEPLFVFVIMVMASARPMLKLAEKLLLKTASILPFDKKMSFYLTAMIVGPLLGSFITEPAAMTLVAIILFHKFYEHRMSSKFKYATVGLLFVNISIGGTLTHFAAPPVVMVASKWGWDTLYMMTHFGYKTILALIISTSVYAFWFKNELKGEIHLTKEKDGHKSPPWFLTLIHILFLLVVVLTAHYPKFFMGIFLIYLGFVKVTEKFQDEPKILSGLMVGFFLASLVTLGTLQSWWLQPLIQSLSDLTLYIGATLLTGITDNAALTYLGSLVDLSETAKYALVAGSVTGGGLTVIANAPNPAGYSILKGAFRGGISPIYLLLSAIIPTLITALCYQLLPSM